jgi:hypothetical protein
MLRYLYMFWQHVLYPDVYHGHHCVLCRDGLQTTPYGMWLYPDNKLLNSTETPCQRKLLLVEKECAFYYQMRQWLQGYRAKYGFYCDVEVSREGVQSLYEQKLAFDWLQTADVQVLFLLHPVSSPLQRGWVFGVEPQRWGYQYRWLHTGPSCTITRSEKRRAAVYLYIEPPEQLYWWHRALYQVIVECTGHVTAAELLQRLHSLLWPLSTRVTMTSTVALDMNRTIFPYRLAPLKSDTVTQKNP